MTMLKLRSLTLALGAIALVTTGMTATAGPGSTRPVWKPAQATTIAPAPMRVAKQDPVAGRDALATGDFEYVGGDAEWQLRQHKFTLRGGTFAHAPDCTLVASASPAAPVAGRKGIGPSGDQSPGA
jgi:hypothetical protein